MIKEMVGLKSKQILRRTAAGVMIAAAVAAAGLYDGTNLPLKNIAAINAEAATIVESGSCGDNAYYMLDSDGTVYINGTGAISDFGSATSSSSSRFCNSKIKKVVVKDGITSIGSYVFYGCTELTSVSIPSSVTSINSYAFAGCSGLTEIIFPDSIVSLGSYAFYGCKGLTTITIPSSVTSMGNYVFYGCSQISFCCYSGSWFENYAYMNDIPCTIVKKVIENGQCGDNVYYVLDSEGTLTISGKWDMDNFDIANDNPSPFYSLTSVKNIIIEEGITSISDEAFYGCSEVESIIIPESVTYIGDSAFYYCSKLTDITIPNSVTYIGNSAFCGCLKLTNITIPDNVTYIGHWAFYSCSELRNVTIPNSVTYIGDAAFRNCGKLIETTISNNITSIHSGTFAYCSSLKSIKIPDKVTFIGSDAFIGCTELTSIIIPDSVTSIGDNAFEGCSELTIYCNYGFYAETYAKKNNILYIHKCGENITYTLNDEGTLAICGTGEMYNYTNDPTLSPFYKSEEITSIVIEEGVESIGSFMFYNCTELTSVIIPNSVKSINAYSFTNCSNITFVCNAGSYAETYAIENSINCALINDNPDCTHSTVSDNGVCSDCKKAFAAKIVLGNVERTEELFEDFSEAVSELGKLYTNAELVVYSDYKGDIAADLPQPVELNLNQCTITGDITLTGSGHFMVCGNGEIDGNIVHGGTGDVDISNGAKTGDIVANSAVSISDSSVGSVTANSFGAYNDTVEINGTITVNGGKAWFYCQPVFNGETDIVLNNGSTIVLAEDFDKDCVVVVDAPAGVVVVSDASYGADFNADNFVSADGYMVVKNDDDAIEFISLVITSQPTDFTGAIDSTAKFTVNATGATSYQWQQNTGAGWTNINTTVGRSKTLSLGVTAARAKYQYRCVISDGTTSLITNAVKMIVKETLAITTQPTNFTGAIGDTAKFTVNATGATSYQWQQNTGAGWININTTVGRSKTFSVGVAQFRLNYQYRCVISDGTNEIISNAVKMVVEEELAITSQPTNYIGAIGDTAKFTVNATGATSYQWEQNTGAGWTAINTTAGRSKTFSVGVAQFRLGYKYRCVVSDGTKTLTSNEVKMVVEEELAITSQPTDFTGAIGDTAKFTVEATGATSYQWQQDTGNGWTAINTTAGRSKTFSIAVAQFRLGYKYRCVVSDGTNTITSNEVQMYIG